MSHVSDSLYKVISHILLSVHYFLILNNIFILVKMEFDVTSAFNNGKNLQRKQDVLDQVIKNKMLLKIIINNITNHNNMNHSSFKP